MFSDEEYLLQLLEDNGAVLSSEIEDARSQAQGGEGAVGALIRTGIISEEQVAQLAAFNTGMEFVDLGELAPDTDAVEMLPADAARRYQAIPLSFDGTFLRVAIADPFDLQTIDSLPHAVRGGEIELVVAPATQIQHAIDQAYGAAESAVAMAVGVETGDEDAPIIRLVQQTLQDAIRSRTSDIHIEPLEKYLRVRYRIDGKLQEMAQHPKKLTPAVISRLKIMTGAMQIAEKRLPQDGRIQLKMADKDIDFRVSSIPTNHGESMVLRILDKSALQLGLPQLGFFSDDQETVEELINLPDGIFLVTGPTGSGKTTTLYSCLHAINRPDRKIITVEDPVEYELAGINQVMVRSEIGMTFAAALRAMLRQAPNIIMLGEIRDGETATIALNASLTGHLVFSTLHTNDAPSAVARLVDMKIKPFLISSALRAALAQRLVRGLCPDCKVDAELSEKEARLLRLDATSLAEADVKGPNGCDKCRNKGYRGRMGIFEIFRIDDEVRGMINQGLSSSVLRRRARELGMRTLREDGVRKVLAGFTSAEEVLSVTMGDAS